MSSQTISKGLFSRPLADFHPNHWTNHVHNLAPHDEETHSRKHNEVKHLKEEVEKQLLATRSKPLEELNLIDTLERLGIAYHFEKEIEEALQSIYETFDDHIDQCDLYQTSVHFRVMRQHGFHVPSHVFNKFKDENGSFKDTLTNDIEGILSLYEACHVRVQGDHILDDAITFTTKFLKSIVNQLSSPLKEKVAHALHQPLHKGMPRLEARHYISNYEKELSHNEILLKFSKLDFNFVQLLHLKELRDFTRWWKGLHVNASYSRDRFAEAYFWIVGVFFEPHYYYARRVFQKLFKVTSLVDDTYDAYGTIEELQLLNEAIQRWEKSSIDQLPEHVKWCYQALLESFEDAEQELAERGRSFCIKYAIDHMKVLSEAYMQEAKWCHEKHIPTYHEYMKVALITSPYPFATVSSFLGMGEIANIEVFEWLCQNPMPKALRGISTVIRLSNDMYGHEFEQRRNHIASVVECYMERHGVSKEEEVHEELLKKVDSAWKDINQAMLQPYAIPKPLLSRILNLARSANVIYKGEDGYTNVSEAMKDKVAAVLFNPIPI